MSTLRLARALALLQVGPNEPDARALAEALWLARWLPPGPAAPGPTPAPAEPNAAGAPPPLGTASHTGPPAPPAVASPMHAPTDAPARVALFTPQRDASGHGALRGTRVRVPAADALPQGAGLDRALRPFMRRRASRVRQELDAAATVQASAEHGQVTPVFRPQMERWFDVALVMDEGDSMAVWMSTAREFKARLARHGAFRQVHLWRLNAAGGRVTLHSEAGLDGAARTLAVGDGRTLVLLLTHGTSAGWKNGVLRDWLRGLARDAVVALLQMLPSHAWPFTALGSAAEPLRSRDRGEPNRRLQRQDLLSGHFVDNPACDLVPVLPLEVDAVAHWAQFVMAPRRLSHPAAWLGEAVPIPAAGFEASPAGAVGGMGRAAGAAGPAAAPAPSARERVQRFRAMGSPAAFDLLRLLAAAPVTLPVMRLLQRVSTDQPATAPLAEVLLSGLLQRVATGAGEDEHVYDFDPEVRDWLLGGLSGRERRSVDTALDPTRERLRAFIEQQTGRRVKDFAALVLDPAGTELLPAQARAFVQVSRQLYERGGVLPAAAAMAPEAASAATAGSGSAEAPPASVPTAPVRPLRVLLQVDPDLRRPPPLEAALRAALVRQGHEPVPAQADVVLLISESAAAADADLIVSPDEEPEAVLAALAHVQPQGALHGWAAPPQLAVARGADADRLHALLRQQLEPPKSRTENGVVVGAELNALPLSGARQLLGEVLARPHWRQHYTGGIWMDQTPPPADEALRRGPRLFVTEADMLTLPIRDKDAVVTLRYRYERDDSDAPPGEFHHIGYLEASTLSDELRRRGVSLDRLAPAMQAAMGVPLLVGVVAAGVARGAAPPPRLPDTPEERFATLVPWMLGSLQPDERRNLFGLAVFEPGPGNLRPLHLDLPRQLGWLLGDEQSSWLLAEARRQLAIADPGGMRTAQASLVSMLRTALYGSSNADLRTKRYAQQHLLTHAWAAGGEAEVLALFGQPPVIGALLAVDEPTLQRQLRVLLDRPGVDAPRLQSLLSKWQALDVQKEPPRDMATALARLAEDLGAPDEPADDVPANREATTQAPTWRPPPGTGIADAFAAKITGRGITVWLPATGVDATHPTLKGARLHGDLRDPNGHGTAVASLIAGSKQGVAPHCELQSTRMLDERGGADMAVLLRTVGGLLEQPPETLPHIACWVLGQPLGRRPPDGAQQELGAMMRELTERGLLFVAAAGNDGPDNFSFPAILPWVLAVGALDTRGEPAPFSSRGRTDVERAERELPDLYGPGVDIPVAVPGRGTQPQSGTSFAAAYVAGIAALFAQSTGLRGLALRQALIDHADERRMARWQPARPMTA